MAPRGLSTVVEVRENMDRQFHNDVMRLTHSRVRSSTFHS